MTAVIWWIRRDLRLQDNQALQWALLQADSLIPLYILDPHLLAKSAPFRRDFLFNSLRSLTHDLEKLHCPLVVRRGDPTEEIPRIFKESGAQAIVAEEDFSSYALRRDRAISRDLPLTLTGGITIHPPGSVLKSDGGIYTVFTPFSHTWKALPLPDQPQPCPPPLPSHPAFFSVPIPSAPESSLFPASEAYAHMQFRNFLENSLEYYAQNRDRMDLEGTSYLSPYLRFGILSARDIYAQLRDFLQENRSSVLKTGADSWLNELIWREFYIHILAAFPHVLKTSFREKYRSIPWRNDPDDLHAWQSGLTGYPIVDAGMRQLLETGWMHNRARMITASFLTKDLLINWQAGETWFIRHLIDGDPASNNGGWQWTAGTGTDAAPYFRVFNPVLQSRKFDPQGTYIRECLPELSNVPDAYIHTPWKMPIDIQSQAGIFIGRDYPKPIIDHRFARQRALDAYKAAA